MRTYLRKVKWNKGETDNGHAYDYTRVYIEIPVYDRQEKEFGVDVLELEFGSEADHRQLVHLRGKLPALVDVEWYAAKKGNDTVNIVTKLDIVQDKPAPKLQQPN